MSFRIYKSEKTSLLRILVCGPASALAQAWWEGFITRAAMSFIINRIAFDTARYCGLGRS